MTEVFVFGSNLSGIHGAGSAKEALQNWGAEWGVGTGRRGNSYAIPTKDKDVYTTLRLSVIQMYVGVFLEYAYERRNVDHFRVVAIGCGLAGYKPWQIAPMFMPVLHGMHYVQLPGEFTEILSRIFNYGG